MSFKLMAKALDIETGSPVKKLVLIKLCDNANDDGYCFPSHKTIAKQCEISQRTVVRATAELESMGLIKKVERNRSNGSFTSNGYHMTFCHLADDTESHGLMTESHNHNLSLEPIKETYSSEVSEVLDHLNNKMGTKYRTAKGLKKRFSEGFTVEDAKKVIDIKFAEWIGDEKMKKYIRPDTLFSEKFDSYLNQEQQPQAGDYFSTQLL